MLLVISQAVVAQHPEAMEPLNVQVTLLDGSELTAVADAETSNEFLVLRFTAPGILLRRHIAWDQVSAAVFDGRSLTAAELRDTFRNQAPDAGIDPLTQLLTRTPPPQRETEAERVVTISSVPVDAAAVDDAGGRVRSLEVMAETANWDRDASIDGIRLYVRPLNAAGDVVPVAGQLNVKLFGQAFLQAGGIRSPRRFDAFPGLGEWTQRLRTQDFSTEGAVYQFEFRRTNPEFLRNIGSFGLTHARLLVPGQGVFEASDAMTRVRPFSVYREWHQQATGRRFLPAEHILPRQ